MWRGRLDGDTAGPEDNNDDNNTPTPSSGLSIQQVVTGLNAPVFLTHADDQQDWGLNAGAVTSFGQDYAGELYMIVAQGSVLKIVASP